MAESAEELRRRVAELEKALRAAHQREEELHFRIEHLFDAFSERNSRLLKRLKVYEKGE